MEKKTVKQSQQFVSWVSEGRNIYVVTKSHSFSRITQDVSEISICTNNAWFKAAFIWFPSTNSTRKCYVVHGHVRTFLCVCVCTYMYIYIYIYI